MVSRSTRSTTSKHFEKSNATQKDKPKAAASKAPGGRSKRKQTEPEDYPEEESEDEQSDAYEDEEEVVSDADSINSENLDDERETKPAKRKRASAKSAKSSPKKTSSPRKKRKTSEEDEDTESELELQDGQEIVGRVVQAPKTGRVPPGQISQNTLDFLAQLKKPECNDREWYVTSIVMFTGPQPVWRVAEKEWKDFVEAFTDVLVANDPQIPYLPPKDAIHRIYRDVRFSNDKTPYKTGLSATFSRSGRKGIFAKFRPDGQSLIAAGAWCPGKNELQTIRNNLQRSSRQFWRIISEETFVGLFGEAKPHPNGGRQSIFGREDELKVAPKGIDKTHKDIDLLKCRSLCVAYEFTDKQVLQPGFKEELGRFVKILRPFVHCINELMTLRDTDNSDDDEGEDEEETDE
ncbi:uncharacterized protein PHACADRAFT_92896 [Phanerochaete carnosa HHB-10118-sp]|uniref:Uncharacterized protein n=1 Tax=Phanerochaete carnosa (strain HHB-10118-sp) TaxID=650164 RepID=K5WCZ0_PHACS|nr:uncharacterized protein PHACADRAFT_92896 [Phanerochaete carnosa HHB-10118-sp]EKM57150.1 hypothetical protein PHACADRAFT_92896 [Phanerochaete carnosa HHB-10118-sp]